MKERNIIAIKLFLTHLVPVPFFIFLSLWLKIYGIQLLLLGQLILGIIVLTGYWEFFGLKFKRFYISISEIALLTLLFHNSWVGKSASPNLWGILFFSLLIYLIVKILRVIFEKPNELIEISFPFKSGEFLITDGSNSKISRLMNYHYHSNVHKKKQTNNSMLYATDIVKVKKDNYYLLLGHLKMGSILVSEGYEVSCDAAFANVGNLGFSERPHLHMQLIKSNTPEYWKGKGICIQYQKKNLYKNRIITVA